jgi:hypothetical protein
LVLLTDSSEGNSSVRLPLPCRTRQGPGSRGWHRATSNGDNILDFLVTNGPITVLLGAGDDTFMPTTACTSGIDGSPHLLAVVHFNSAPSHQIFAATQSSTISS